MQMLDHPVLAQLAHKLAEAGLGISNKALTEIAAANMAQVTGLQRQ